MFAKKVSVYAGLERRKRPNCISEKCIKCAPKRKARGSNPRKDAKKSSFERVRIFYGLFAARFTRFCKAFKSSYSQLKTAGGYSKRVTAKYSAIFFFKLSALTKPAVYP